VPVVSVAAWEQAVGVADAYRSGRVFLAGDSAHVWPPAGAMGANSAVQDANNLAWKLGAVRAGLAGDALLDTYEAERRPVALALADLTVRRQAARFSGGLDDDIDDLVLTLGQRYRSAAILGRYLAGCSTADLAVVLAFMRAGRQAADEEITRIRQQGIRHATRRPRPS